MDAPERIWVGPDGLYWYCPVEDIRSEEDTEYVRADLYARLAADLAKATSPKYLATAIEKVGMVDAEWKERAARLAAENERLKREREASAMAAGQDDWREIEQRIQPRLADGYTAVAISKPGFWKVKGPGPADAHAAIRARAALSGGKDGE